MSEQATVPHRVSGVPLRAIRVEVEEGPEAGKHFTASSDTVTIGTADSNDLVVSDPTVSRYHIELQRRGDRIEVTDLDSTNGTQVGGVLITRGRVSAGTRLQLGKSIIRIDDGERTELELHGHDNFLGLRGRAPEMRALMARLDRVAQTDASVLLLGETGTGKEVFARALHEASPRSNRAFETVDCGSLMPTLVASELFGHEKGSFTGADAQHVGAFERANGGTIFLDEIGELPSTLQPVLLGALERRSFRRIGGSKPIPVDVRVVCATNRDLRNEVNLGSFRADLYYRIGVVLLRIPPLRERVQDIPLLAEHFLREAGFNGELSEVLPPELIGSLNQHHWPGNVRELRNFVEAALAMGEAPHLEELRSQAMERGGSPGDFPAMPIGQLVELPYKDARGALLDDFEKRYLEHLIERAKGNVSEASRVAQMNRSYLIEMLKRHKIQSTRRPG